MRALIVSADGFEDSELQVPLLRSKEEGIAVDVASIRRGRIRGKHGCEIEVGKRLEEVRPADYDLLLLPGGKGPRGPQILVSAGVMKGRRATCFHAIAAELRDAGAFYEDRESCRR